MVSIPALALLFACGQAEPRCDGVSSAIVTSYSADPGCTSPVGVCTTGNVSSGNLAGTTQFTALTLQAGPSPDLHLYTGDLTITTASGTVTLRDSGILNSTTGYYFEVQQVTDATGAQEGSSGILISEGLATATGFEGSLSGSLCLME
ncbi:MAG TPA: hypothetical protein VMK66_05850 [Myxococcales bacterium]|nr:hypothetical protein [Myxococcales bacterium]